MKNKKAFAKKEGFT